MIKISLQASIALAVVFASICFGVAVKGLLSLSEITDPTILADARGFAMFWAFLGAIAVAFAGVGIWLIKTQKPGDGE